MLEMLKERKAALEAQGKKGFTLMEMLIVIAIIAILIAIAIPIFSDQMEAANEAKDAANLRSAYAIASAKVLTDNADAACGPVAITQTGDWTHVKEKIAGKDLPKTGPVYVKVTKAGNVTFETTAPTGAVPLSS